ncbi:long-chain fatty acid--CoA ligase [Actinocrinis puniceicyclus]|uniref:Long-chain fatty acid--CoA ligase n=1 Tax=Actinocrinis puniceicyclus TaxID=977794 RepID=A0A8J7WM08_9ACTN|nr:long-chain fatty acid--CoA ligase [Actinocrinis puniceicyclus]
MASTMQDYPLTITAILRHGSLIYGGSECVTWAGAGNPPRRASYAEIARNAERLAAALDRLGIGAGDRVGTFCWNTQEHLEAYFAVPCMGAVLHTLNIRLPGDQLAHIVQHAGDRVIIVDGSLAPLLAAIAPGLSGVEAYIVVGEADLSRFAGLPADVRVLRYSELLAAEEPGYQWPQIDELSAAAMCYTSGTTGEPKGVVYSHRSTFLHALAGQSACMAGTTESDRILTIVPMFHVNAWGIPYGAFLGGATLHMPGPHMGPDGLVDFIEAERSTVASAVPTIWNWILSYGEARAIDLSSLRLATSGGSAAPRALIEAFDRRYGVRIIQGWGMTETSPVAGMAHPPAGVEPGTAEDVDWRLKSGRVAAGVEMRVVDVENGRSLPWDGASVGEIEVRGPWITGSYYRDPAPEKFHDGWLRTGDLGTIDERGFFQVTDRVKDLIKSGGEWISSVELENQLLGHPDVLEAAVVAIPDPTWVERPLACVVRRPDAQGRAPATAETLAAFLAGKVARWQVPDYWAFVDEVPKTTVGKFDKKVLRARHREGTLDVRRLEHIPGAEHGTEQSTDKGADKGADGSV